MDYLCVPDLHIPFHHKDALLFVKSVEQEWFWKNKKVIVFLGDEVDSHSISRHMPDPDGRSPKDELEEAKKHLRDWYRAFPKAHVCQSNHTIRPWKKAYESGIPKEFLRSIAEVYAAPPGWKWQDRFFGDGICFEHGENVSGPLGALNAAKQNQMSTVIGHLHSFGGAVHSDNFHGKLWGLNTGCLIDVEAYAFAYGKNYRNKPTLGCGVIKNGVPYFVPMLLNEEGRWVGNVY